MVNYIDLQQIIYDSYKFVHFLWEDLFISRKLWTLGSNKSVFVTLWYQVFFCIVDNDEDLFTAVNKIDEKQKDGDAQVILHEH